MKFTTGRIVQVADLKSIDQKINDLDFTDLDKAQESLDDITMLHANIMKYGCSEPVIDLIGGTLESWQISITDKEACLEGLVEKAKKIGKAIWDAIVAAIKRIIEFITGLFSKQRTSAFLQKSKEVKDDVEGVVDSDASAKSTVNDASEDKAESAGNVTSPASQGTISIAEHERMLNEVKNEVRRCEQRIRFANKRADELGTSASLNFETAVQYRGENMALKSALSALETVSKADKATIGDIKKSVGFVSFALNERRRIISLKLQLCGNLLNVSKQLNASFERMTKHEGWRKSLDGIKELAESKSDTLIPASAIGPAASEISQVVSIMVATEFEGGDAFLEWRDSKALNGCKYLALDGTVVTIKASAKKDSTLGKLGYLKDYVFGELDKKYEGTAAVVNKIQTLIHSLDEEIKVLVSISEQVDKVN